MHISYPSDIALDLDTTKYSTICVVHTFSCEHRDCTLSPPFASASQAHIIHCHSVSATSSVTMASSTTAAPSTSTFPVPQDFIGWIEAHGHELKPPVGNKLMYGAGQMKVMIVAGPNDRNDFHIEEGEVWVCVKWMMEQCATQTRLCVCVSRPQEMFFMVKGNMQLNIIERGEFKEIPIKEGQIFMLPKHIPHSPQVGVQAE